MQLDEAKAITASLPATDTSEGHFTKALNFDGMAKRSEPGTKRDMALKALDRHLTAAAALETLGR